MSAGGGERLEKDFSRSCLMHLEKWQARRVSEPDCGLLFFLVGFPVRLNRPIIVFEDPFFNCRFSDLCVCRSEDGAWARENVSFAFVC